MPWRLCYLTWGFLISSEGRGSCLCTKDFFGLLITSGIFFVAKLLDHYLGFELILAVDVYHFLDSDSSLDYDLTLNLNITLDIVKAKLMENHHSFSNVPLFVNPISSNYLFAPWFSSFKLYNPYLMGSILTPLQWVVA